MNKKQLLSSIGVVLLLLIASLFLFPSFRNFLSSRVLPIPPVTETMVGGRLASTPLPGQHTLTYEARTSTGQTITDSVTFTQPNPSTSPTPQCNNNGIPEAGEACDTGPSTLKDYCSNRCQVELDVTEYGATKDTEDTTVANSDSFSIQNAMNSAKGLLPSTSDPNPKRHIPPGTAPVKTPPTFNPPDTLVTTVYFPAGTYYVSQVHPWQGTTLVGAGTNTIIKRLKDRDSFERMFNTGELQLDTETTKVYWEPVGDPALPLTIKHMTFDGNGTNQLGLIGSGTGSTEHQDILYLYAGSGTYKVLLEDLYFTEAGAAAIDARENIDITARDIECMNNYICFYTSKAPTTVLAEHFNAHNDLTWPPAESSTGQLPTRAYWSEADYGAVNATLNDWDVSNLNLSVQLHQNAILNIDDWHADLPDMYMFIDPGTQMRVSNSSFTYGPHARNLKINFRQPGDIVFTNTKFTATEKYLATEANSTFNGWNVNWIGEDVTNTTVKCINCTFDADATVEDSDTVRAIATGENKVWKNDVIYLEGGSFSNKIDVGLYMGDLLDAAGGRYHIKGTQFFSGLAMSLHSYTFSRNWNVTLEGTPTSTLADSMIEMRNPPQAGLDIINRIP